MRNGMQVVRVLAGLALLSAFVAALGFGAAQSARHAEERAQAVLASGGR